MLTIFKVFIEFVTILFLFYVLLFWPQDMRDLSSPARDQTHTPGIGGPMLKSLDHQGSPHIPIFSIFCLIFFPYVTSTMICLIFFFKSSHLEKLTYLL